MSVRPFVYQSNDPNVHLARLTEAQAKKLIDYLAAEGFLQQAVELGKQEVPDRDPYEKCYTIQVSTQKLHLDEDRGWVPALQLHEDLGWGPATLKRLDGLRRALDGEAARAMDSFLAGLADDRNKWAAGAAEPAQPRGEKPAIPRQHVPVPNPEK
jgi:hypothetical protein